MMGASLLIHLAAAGAVAVFTPQASLILAGDEVRLGDVASLKGTAAEQLKSLVVARVAGARTTVSRAALAALVRRRVPGLEVAGAGAGSLTIIQAHRPADGARCKAVARPIAVGQLLDAADFVSAACDPRPPSPYVKRDPATGELRASRALAVGDNVGPLTVPPPPVVQRGAQLRLVSRAGPVSIVRTVTALQPARSSQRRLFVRTADGEVLSAQLENGR